MCGGNGSLLGAIIGGALAYSTGGFSLAAGSMGAAAAGGAAGAVAGDSLIDKPQQLQQSIAAQRSAAEQAVRSAERQADLLYNTAQRGTPKSPDVGAMLSWNKQQSAGGGSSTMLTGPGGIDPTSLNLGRTSLLGS